MILPTHIVAASGIVENDRNEILLVKNRRGEWTWTGGIVEIGENIIDAVIREIKEESGVDAVVNKLVGVSSNTAAHEGYNGVKVVPTKVMFEFVCTYIGGELSDSDETSESRWVPKDKVLDYITIPNLQERFKAYLNFDGNIQYLDYISQPKYILKLKRHI